MNIAIVGTGFISEWFLEAAANIDSVNIDALYSRNKEKGEAFINKHQIKKLYTDYQELLQDAQIDCIYIASPNSLHYTYAKKALLAQKHVICEKPFTSTLEEFLELKTYAIKHHLFLFEAIVTKSMPNYLLMKEHLQDLGKIRMIQCNFSQYSSRYTAFKHGELPNVFNPKFSGGALADLNIYNLHFVIGLFGKPIKALYYPNIEKNIDISGVAILEYDTFKAVCVACKDSTSQSITQIQGEDGYITVNAPTSTCSHFTLTTYEHTIDISDKQVMPVLYYELQHFIDIMQKQDFNTCVHLLEESQKVMEVYQELRKSGNIVFEADKK